MNTVTIGVSSLEDMRHRTAAAFRGRKQGARISFATEELLWKTLTPKRWALLKTMAGRHALAIREIARRLADLYEALGRTTDSARQRATHVARRLEELQQRAEEGAPGR